MAEAMKMTMGYLDGWKNDDDVGSPSYGVGPILLFFYLTFFLSLSLFSISLVFFLNINNIRAWRGFEHCNRRTEYPCLRRMSVPSTEEWSRVKPGLFIAQSSQHSIESEVKVGISEFLQGVELISLPLSLSLFFSLSISLSLSRSNSSSLIPVLEFMFFFLEFTISFLSHNACKRRTKGTDLNTLCIYAFYKLQTKPLHMAVVLL